MSIFERVRLRIDESIASDDLVIDCIETIEARLCLRLNVGELPEIFGAICADAVVKMCRRFYYEGISSENIASANSVSFVEDILSEYETEIENWKNSTDNHCSKARKIKFL